MSRASEVVAEHTHDAVDRASKHPAQQASPRISPYYHAPRLPVHSSQRPFNLADSFGKPAMILKVGGLMSASQQRELPSSLVASMINHR